MKSSGGRSGLRGRGKVSFAASLAAAMNRYGDAPIADSIIVRSTRLSSAGQCIRPLEHQIAEENRRAIRRLKMNRGHNNLWGERKRKVSLVR